ncbi:MAG: DoxX family protein [Sulfuricurvum sp.]|nr:DoxX family protein [Sulfuricurvum sp.]
MKKIGMLFNEGQDLALLLLRLILAYGFYSPAMNKWADIGAVATWFEQDLGIPFPLLNAYMAASTEMAGVVLLVLGLGVRLIALPLMVVMIVAITTVHLANGFSAGDSGFEIPLYYLLMLFTLATHGGGKFGVDYFLKKE